MGQLDSKAREYLEGLRKARESEESDERKRLYSSLDLYNKEYIEGKTTAEYPLWDSYEGKAYRVDYPTLTDEEYAELRSYNDQKKYVGGNTVASVITVIAWITYIGGFILGIALSTFKEQTQGIYYMSTETIFSWNSAFTIWGQAFVSGTLLLGFAEIIKLLARLVDAKNKEAGS